MQKDFATYLALFKSRLSWKIMFWVFISIIVVEAIILLPSVYRRQHEVLDYKIQIGLATLTPIIEFGGDTLSREEILDKARSLRSNFPIVGVSLYHRETGQQMAVIGEPSTLGLTDVQNITHDLKQQSADGTSYDVAWRIKEMGREYLLSKALIEQLHECSYKQEMNCPDATEMVLVMRFNADRINEEVMAFIWRIIGLIALICLFVTAVTLVMLTPTVIMPILKLRNALLQVGENTRNHETACHAPPKLLVNRRDELGDVMGAFNIMNQQIAHYVQEIRARERDLKQAISELKTAQDQTEALLLNILPAPIAEELKQGVSPIAQSFPAATVLFADLAGFTQLSDKKPPTEIVELLNELFTEFDLLAEKHHMEKIKTIGDAYMAVGGLPTPFEHHAESGANMALDMLKFMQQFNKNRHEQISLRIGINTGPVVAGVIGVKKFIYDLWGDTVNIASRMESHGIVGTIQVSDSTYQCLQHSHQFEVRGMIPIKGKGKMETYLLIGHKSQYAQVVANRPSIV